MTHGPEEFLEEISRATRKYSDIITIPGCTTSAYYFWTGSPLKKTLTAHEYAHRIIISNFDQVDDYPLIPNLANDLSFKYTKRLLPGLMVFLVPLFFRLCALKVERFLPPHGLNPHYFFDPGHC